MRKQFLLLMALCLAVGQSWAERIDVATAREVARTVASRGSTLRSAGELSLVYAAAPGQTGSALRSASAAGEADYFVFNVPGDGGFVIVAGDDRVRPVLGYSHSGSFDPDNLPENLRGMLAFYQDQITWAEDNAVEASPAISAEWSQYQSGTALRAAGNGVLLETANWGQGEPYNRMTPENAVTGCVATAMGIIMRYHEYPDKAVNPPASNSYWYVGDPIETKIDYSEGYNWDNMPLSYSDYTDVQANEVSKLLYHCGANVEMIYNQDGGGESGTQTIRVAKALSEVFGYSPSVRYLQREAYRWDEWKAMIRAELDAGYPLIYDGQNPVGGGHAFVCDGYTPEGLFHINWGWNGDSNGYYQLSVLDDDGDGYGYSDGQGAVLNIRPEQSGERYYMRPYLRQTSYQKTGDAVFASNITVVYFALHDHVFYFELGVVNADGSIVQKPTNPVAVNFKVDELGIPTPTSNYSRGITLASPLSEGQYVTFLCSEDGENWEVMRTGKDVPLGIDADGMIYPSEDIPDEPEQPMFVGIYWNDFDDNSLQVTGLDNSQSAPESNVQGISYGFSGRQADATIRYTITNYADWKDHIAIYYGDDRSIREAGAGTLVAIGDNGVFEISVAKSDIEDGDGAYVNYMKVLSDKAGELTFSLEVYSDGILYLESKGHAMSFVGEEEDPITPPLTAKITTNSLDDTRGAVGETVFGSVYCQVSDLSRVGHFVYELEDPSWADSLTIWYNNDSNADLSAWKKMDFKDGKGTILFSDCAVDSSMSLVKNYLNVRALKAGTVNYKIHVYDDASALCATSEHSFVVEEVSIPLTLPETISGDLNAGPVSFEIRTGDVGAFAGQTIELEMQTNSHEDTALVVSYEGTDYKFVDQVSGNGVVQAYCPLTLESDKTYTFSLTGKKSTEGASFPYMYFIWRDTAGNVLPVSNSNPVLLDLKYVNVIPAGEEETLEGAVDAIEIGSGEGDSSSSDTSKVVLNGVTTPEITVKEEAKAVLTLSGTNNLGTVTNQGTLIIEVDEESSEVPVSLTVSITNNGVLTDYTGQVTNVEGEASLQINKIGEQEIEPDASVTLTATAVIAEGATVTFQWQWFNVNTNSWVDVPNDEASAQAAAMLRAATTKEESSLEVSAADAGNYRCLVTSVAKVGEKEVSTTLTTYATVSVKDPDPTPGPDPTPTPTTYIVTLPVVEGATIEAVGSTSVKAGDSFSFTVTVKEGYVATNMVVKANGVTLTPNADGRYTISDVRSNVVVTVAGIEEDPATAIESVDTSGLKVWAADGRLFIQTPRADKAYVVTFDGRLYKALDLPAGETVTPMPQGAYIIYIGERSFKVVL